VQQNPRIPAKLNFLNNDQFRIMVVIFSANHFSSDRIVDWPYILKN
jgi:hypothetical protein